MAVPPFVQGWSGTSKGAGTITAPDVEPSGGANSVLVAIITIRDAAATSVVTDVAYAGAEAFSKAHDVQYFGDARVEFWVLTGPAAESGDVVATFSGTPNACIWVGEYTGVDQTTPIGAVSAPAGSTGANSQTWTITTQHADSRIVSGVSYGTSIGTLSWTSPEEHRLFIETGTSGTDNQGLMGDRAAPTPGGYTISAQVSAQAHEWSCGTIELRAAAGGGTDATATPSGVEGTGEVGTVSVSTSTTVALTGLEAAGEAGSVATVAGAVAAPTGVEGQGRVGSVATAYGGAATVAGIEGATAVGTVIVSAGVNDNAAPTGVGGVGTVGTVTVALDGTAAVEGVSGTGRVGSVLAGAGTGAVVSGVQGAGAVGTVSVSTDAEVPVVGVAASGEIGASDVTIGAAVAVTGVAAVGQVGTVSAFEAAAVTFGRITVTQSAATAISVSAWLATGLATDAREVTGLEATESAA